MRKLISTLAVAIALSAFSYPASAFERIIEDDTFPDDSSPAVPEPTAALAMGAGLATIAVALRRRR